MIIVCWQTILMKYPDFSQKLGKMSHNLSSAAVLIGPLRVKVIWSFEIISTNVFFGLFELFCPTISSQIIWLTQFVCQPFHLILLVQSTMHHSTSWMTCFVKRMSECIPFFTMTVHEHVLALLKPMEFSKRLDL